MTRSRTPPAAEPWETVPGHQVERFVAAFRRLGVELEPQVDDIGIALPEVKAETPLDARRVATWAERMLQAHPHRGLGLIYGEALLPLHLGMLGYAIVSSETLGEAARIWVDYSALVRPYMVTRMQTRDDGLVEVSFVDRELPLVGPLMRAFCLERDLAGWAHAMRSLVGPGRHIEEVHCAYPDPQLSEAYREVFGCPVRYNRPVSSLLFKEALLEQPMRYAHGEAHDICVEQCEALLKRMTGAASVTTALRRMMLARPRRLPDLDEAAKALETSTRTLRRKLQEEGTAFSEVLHDVRMRLACDFLAGTQLPVGEIASLLGYSDESALGRAFRRSHAVTPRAWRAEHRAALRGEG